MGLISRLLGRETRAATVRTSDPFLSEFFGFRGAVGAVSPDATLSNLPVAGRCVSIRSELTASVPLHLYRRTPDGGRERADDHPLYAALHHMANPNQSAFEAREFMVRCLDLHGNAYARLERDARGRVVAIYPLLPLAVGVERCPPDGCATA